jgi:hypothetical protein
LVLRCMKKKKEKKVRCKMSWCSCDEARHTSLIFQRPLRMVILRFFLVPPKLFTTIKFPQTETICLSLTGISRTRENSPIDREAYKHRPRNGKCIRFGLAS